eukprot:GHVS01024133.1.p1 GENE.GHVS01024133.1~~GHVS01024133.1.p1  ORF type:complete len:728 (+),score=49.70 GHVS01024133.1:153-2336(+)
MISPPASVEGRERKEARPWNTNETLHTSGEGSLAQGRTSVRANQKRTEEDNSVREICRGDESPWRRKEFDEKDEDDAEESAREAPAYELPSVNVEGQVPTAPGFGMKYLVVTGGTMSGLGKGTTISSLGVVLKNCGLSVTAMKIDPYLNVDAGTMSPYEHGEVYVLEDGGEVDLDLGNYERFLNITLTRDHNLTTGKVYQRVINRERRGSYLGKTVQVVPHVTDEIQSWIRRVSVVPVSRKKNRPDVCLIEVGGTVGDIESSVYLEALQQFSSSVGNSNFCLCHVSYVPIMGVVGEQKSKPTQNSVKELRQAGLKPDFIFCRCESPLMESTRAKIALFSQVPPTHVISVHDVSNIYRVPLVMEDQHVADHIMQKFRLLSRPTSPMTGGRVYNCPSTIKNWRRLADRVDMKVKARYVTIGIVGKYTGLADSYLSVIKALQHAAIEAGLKLKIVWIESTDLEIETRSRDAQGAANFESAWDRLRAADGIVCPGGFGDRGIEGKAASAGYCRKHKKPYLGICLGMQTAVIDFARDVLGLVDANSEEFASESRNKVVIPMPEHNVEHKGGTMRLGKRPTFVRDDPKSLAYKLYDHQPRIDERHRHRYEVNPSYVAQLEEKGLHFVGHDDTNQRMEIAELYDHPFFICVQFHPEFQSRPMSPAPTFLGLVLASVNQLTARLERKGGYLRAGSAYSEDNALEISLFGEDVPEALGGITLCPAANGSSNLTTFA